MKYSVILADPAWHEVTYSHKGQGRSAAAHYDAMSIDAITALPVADYAARDGWLFLWTTWPMLRQAMGVIDAWAFTYSSNAFVWIKTKKDGSPRMNCGHTTRKCTELCLLAKRGKGVLRKSASVRDVILAPQREPHRKPDEQYGMIEALYDGPYLELFARYRRPGWDVALSDQIETGATARRWKSTSYPEQSGVAEDKDAYMRRAGDQVLVGVNRPPLQLKEPQ
jgi:N6-adenosine-specific RNA methylase IME4